jgi:hypothetical protein
VQVAREHIAMCIPLLLQHTRHKSARLREAAAYGLGVCAVRRKSPRYNRPRCAVIVLVAAQMRGGVDFGAYARDTVAALSELVQRPSLPSTVCNAHDKRDMRRACVRACVRMWVRAHVEPAMGVHARIG